MTAITQEEMTFLTTHTLRGTRIGELYQSLSDEISLCQFIYEDMFSNDWSFEESVVLSARRSIYMMVRQYMNELFHIDYFEPDVFRRKTFRGKKILTLLKFLEFQANQIQTLFQIASRFDLSISDSIFTVPRSQLAVLRQLSASIRTVFIQYAQEGADTDV